MIGTGKMGLPVCRRLNAVDHAVTVLVRRSKHTVKFAEAGFKAENSMPALFGGADTVSACLPDHAVFAAASHGLAERDFFVLVEEATQLAIGTKA